MGIQGLLPLLKEIQRDVSVRNFKGWTVGIDAYCWLHKGAYGCAGDLAIGKESNVYINYVMRRVNMLLDYGVIPILVFDGGHLPAKLDKEKERRVKKVDQLKKGKAFLRNGEKSKANDCFQKCVEITPAMATNVIKACYSLGVKCIVAPYEADAQLAYLMKQGTTQLTITEDSDLLLFGCSKVLFKMNGDGNGSLIDLEELNKVKTIQLGMFSLELFRHMCILSGCDYLSSIKGMGLMTAYRLLKKYRDVYKALKVYRLDNPSKVPEGYEESFKNADMVFKYQKVFDTDKRKMVPLSHVDEADDVSEENLTYAGPEFEHERALQIALGNIDPISGRTLADHTAFADELPRPVASAQRSSESRTSAEIHSALKFSKKTTSSSAQKHMNDVSAFFKRKQPESCSKRLSLALDDDTNDSMDVISQSYCVAKTTEMPDDMTDDIIWEDVDMDEIEMTQMGTDSNPPDRRHDNSYSKLNPFRLAAKKQTETQPIIKSRYFSSSPSDGDHSKERPSTVDYDTDDDEPEISTSSVDNEADTTPHSSFLEKLDSSFTSGKENAPLSPSVVKPSRHSFLNYLDRQSQQTNRSPLKTSPVNTQQADLHSTKDDLSKTKTPNKCDIKAPSLLHSAKSKKREVISINLNKSRINSATEDSDVLFSVTRLPASVARLQRKSPSKLKIKNRIDQNSPEREQIVVSADEDVPEDTDDLNDSSAAAISEILDDQPDEETLVELIHCSKGTLSAGRPKRKTPRRLSLGLSKRTRVSTKLQPVDSGLVQSKLNWNQFAFKRQTPRRLVAS